MKFIAFIVVLIGLFYLSIIVVKSSNSSSCYAFGRESGRIVKAVEYNIFYYDCLTLVDDNKWISAYNLRAD